MNRFNPTVQDPNHPQSWIQTLLMVNDVNECVGGRRGAGFEQMMFVCLLRPRVCVRVKTLAVSPQIRP